MISIKEQTNILNSLELKTGIVDVYFHKDTLYMVNSYDEASVTQFMDASGRNSIRLQSIEEAELAF